MPAASAPLPPVELARRIGVPGDADPLAYYLQEGAANRARIERCLPPDWTFDGKRVLDFGCGSARVLRQFLDEAQRAEFWGCDIDGPSIDWIRANLSPPLHCLQNGFEPPLALEDGSFDLIWAMSVFTHIDRWSDWLAELHRIMAPDGLLIASFLGEGVWDDLVGEPYREDEVGMTVLGHWEGAEARVFHSEWWLRAHWGRAFEVLRVTRPPRRADRSAEGTHSYIVVRKLPVLITTEELERCDPDEPRELAGQHTNVRLLRAEIDTLIDERSRPVTVREAVLRSPLRGPARTLHRRVRRRSA